MIHTLSHLLHKTRFRRLVIVFFVFSLLLGLMVVPLEQNHPQAVIKSSFDAIWWTVTTITTVGYGDLVPVTNAGKIVSMILQFFGVIMYGSLIAMVNIALNRHQSEYRHKRVMEKIDLLDQKISKIEKESQFLVKKESE